MYVCIITILQIAKLGLFMTFNYEIFRKWTLLHADFIKEILVQFLFHFIEHIKEKFASVRVFRR